MRTLHSAVLLLLAFLAVSCAQPNSITGKVTADGAPLSGQPVLLQDHSGQLAATATTGTDGTFEFKGVSQSIYVVAVDVPSTLEHHLQAAVSVSGLTLVPDLAFTGTAIVSGTVTDNGAPVDHATVVVLGTERTAITDAQGAFTFTDFPSGLHVVSVTTPTGQANSEIRVTRGQSNTVNLVVAANPPGTVTGSVGFFVPSALTAITLSVPGTSATTTAHADGSFRLDAPAGTWEVWAQAPHYPSQKIGTVRVASGQTVSLLPATLSLYTDLPTFGIAGGSWRADDTADSIHHDAVVLELDAPNFPPSFYRFDLQSHALTLISAGGLHPSLSPDGAWAAMYQGAEVQFVQPGTTQGFSVPVSGSVTKIRFFPDNTAAAITTSTPNRLYLVKLASQAVTSTNADLVLPLGAARMLVQTSSTSPQSGSYSVITSAGIIPVFVQALATTVGDEDVGFALGIEDCASSPCPVVALGPNSTSAVALPGATSNGLLDEGAWQSSWVVLTTDSGTYLVNVDTGETRDLFGAISVQFSPDGTHIAFANAAGSALYVEPLPLPTSLTPVQTASSGLFGAWLGSNQLVGFNDSPAAGPPHKFVVDESGTVSEDANYLPGSGFSNLYYAAYRGSDGVARVQSGAGYVVTAPNGQTTLPVQAAAQVSLHRVEGALTAVTGDALMVSWDGATTWLYGKGTPPQALSAVVPSIGSSAALGGLRPAMNGAIPVVVDVVSGEVLPLYEPGISTSANFQTSATETPTTLVVARRWDANGNETGGAFALFPTAL